MKISSNFLTNFEPYAHLLLSLSLCYDVVVFLTVPIILLQVGIIHNRFWQFIKIFTDTDQNPY